MPIENAKNTYRKQKRPCRKTKKQWETLYKNTKENNRNPIEKKQQKPDEKKRKNCRKPIE